MQRTYNQTFCSAPFIHMYVHKNEDIRACCMTTEYGLVHDNTELDLEKRWRSKYYRDLRQQFLDGKEPEICTKCFSTEKHGGTSDRIRFNRIYSDILEPNIETGNQYDSPIDLDLRPGNLCNLKCRMCGPVSSSQIQKETQNNIEVQEIFGKGDIIETEGVFDGKNLEFLLRNADKGRRIKFLGGEPTIMPEVDDMLSLMISNEQTDIPLHFTTNVTNNTEKFISKISQFKNVAFNYSVDGTGKVVEYIRHPVSFDKLNDNIAVYQKIAEQGEFGDGGIGFTYQAYNFFNLYDTFKWSLRMGVNFWVDLLVGPDWCSVLCIPKDIRDKELLRLRKILAKQTANNIIPTIDRILEDDREYGLTQLARYTKILDKNRKQHIKDFIPEIWEIIREEYDAIQL